MQTKERIFVYGALAGLAAVVAFQLPAQKAGAVWSPADLGPADALILTGKDHNLTLKNGDGRVQWGEQPTAKAWSIAAVNTDKIMKALLKSNRFEEERKSLQDEATAKEADFNKRYKDFREKYKDLDPKSPGAEEAQREYDAFRKETGDWGKTMNERFNKMQSDQIEKAYRDLTAAVDVLSERQKLDLVVRFIPTAAKFETEEVGDAMMQVQSRTFLHYPEAIDMTAEVMKELGLKDE